MIQQGKSKLLSAAAIVGLLISSHSLNAAILYDQNVTPDIINGTGIANGSFTVDRANGVELGLRGKLRHNASGSPENTFNSNGDGTYSFDAGVAPTQSSPTGVWSFEWSINSDWDGSASTDIGNGRTTPRALDQLTYLLGYDSDPTLATSYSEFDPINTDPTDTVPDHALGTNGTANGGGTSYNSSYGDYETAIGANNVAQNSWKAHWFLTSFDPTLDGQYDFYLKAFDGATLLAQTNMSIIVGNGATASVPEPGSLALLCLGLLGFAAVRKKGLAR